MFKSPCVPTPSLLLGIIVIKCGRVIVGNMTSHCFHFFLFIFSASCVTIFLAYFSVAIFYSNS